MWHSLLFHPSRDYHFNLFCFLFPHSHSPLLLFLFCFCLVRGEKVTDAQDFGWQSKGEDHFKSWFPFFSYLLVTIQYCSDIVWSKDLSVYLFCFLPIFDREFFFLFCFLPMSNRELSFSFVFFQSLIGNFFFFFFVFFRGQGWTFSPLVKVYGKLGFWLKAC